MSLQVPMKNTSDSWSETHATLGGVQPNSYGQSMENQDRPD
tara:strand:- start:388 stop:510 length:123 start_codon:yes stop_codon:yes gene_type:complete